MRARSQYEPMRDTVGAPLGDRDELEVDPSDAARPLFTFYGGELTCFESAQATINVTDLGVCEIRGTEIGLPPWTVVFIHPTERNTYDIRSAESTTVRRRFLGHVDIVRVERDPIYVAELVLHRGGDFVLDDLMLIGACVWPRHALNRAEVEDILGSPGGFFRHIRQKIPHTTRVSGTTSASIGGVT